MIEICRGRGAQYTLIIRVWMPSTMRSVRSPRLTTMRFRSFGYALRFWLLFVCCQVGKLVKAREVSHAECIAVLF